jgi:hypothetical protein
VVRLVPLFCEIVVPSSQGTSVFKMEVLGFFETPETTRLTTASQPHDLNRHQHRCGSSSNARLQLVTRPRSAESRSDRTSAYSRTQWAARCGMIIAGCATTWLTTVSFMVDRYQVSDAPQTVAPFGPERVSSSHWRLMC